MTTTQKICCIEGCEQTLYARGLCQSHYYHQRRRAAGVPTARERYNAARKFSQQEERLLRQQYESGKTLQWLAQHHESNTATIAQCVRRAGGTLRKPGTSSRPHMQTFDPQKLRAVREKARLTQAELADKIGCPKPDLIRQWEKGERTPSATYLLRILVACNARPAALLSAPPPAW